MARFVCDRPESTAVGGADAHKDARSDITRGAPLRCWGCGTTTCMGERFERSGGGAVRCCSQHT